MSGSVVFRWCFVGFLLVVVASGAWAADPRVSNVTAQQRADGKVEVGYDLSGAASGGATVSIKVSDDGGSSYTITPSVGALSGDVGAGVGNGRRIAAPTGARRPTAAAASASASQEHRNDESGKMKEGKNTGHRYCIARS